MKARKGAKKLPIKLEKKHGGTKEIFKGTMIAEFTKKKAIKINKKERGFIVA